jgi:uncharacterized protein
MNRSLSHLAIAVLTATLLVGGGTSVLAQAAGTAGAATASSVSPSHLALGRELVALTGITTIIDAMLPEFPAHVRQMTLTRPELTNDLNQVLEAIRPEIEAQKEEMVNAMARAYAANISEAELKDIVAFFKTASGRKYLEAVPRVMDDITGEAPRWYQRVSEFVMSRVRTEMGKRGHQL